MAADDAFKGFPVRKDDPADHVALVTPNDSADLSYVTRAIMAGVSGALRVMTAGGEDVTIPATCVVAGQLIPIRVTRVYATSTTATSIVALW